MVACSLSSPWRARLLSENFGVAPRTRGAPDGIVASRFQPFAYFLRYAFCENCGSYVKTKAKSVLEISVTIGANFPAFLL
jgi:hypothetical protein